MSTRQPQNKQPKGFRKPTTTPTPDEIFDVWLPELKPSELKVLLYIVRRTFGFGKDADSISINQICNGITKKNGDQLDRGTGLSRTAAWKAVKSLEKKGLITVDRVMDDDGVNEINVYSLAFQDDDPEDPPDESDDADDDDDDGGGVGKKITYGSAKSEQGGRLKNNPGVGKKITPQQTVIQQTEQQQRRRKRTKRSLSNNSGGDPNQDVVVALTDLGIAQRVATRLSKRYNRDRIFEKIDFLAFLEETDPEKIKNPRGWLRTAIEENYGPPDGYKPKEQREAEAAAAERRRREIEAAIEAQEDRPPRDWQAWMFAHRDLSAELQQLTEKLQEQLQLQTTQATYNALLRNLAITELHDEDVQIAVASQQAYEWIVHRFAKQIHETLQQLVGYDVDVTFEVVERNPDKGETEQSQEEQEG